MNNTDILLLIKILVKQKKRKDLADLLSHSYSNLNESSTYGSRYCSYLTVFEIYSPIEKHLLLSQLSEKDYDVLLESVKIIYPNRDQEPEIVKIEFFPDPRIEYEENTKIIIENPTLIYTNDVVERTISDSELLLKEKGAISAIDRIHTALHGYLKEICKQTKIDFENHDSITRLFRLLRKNHPRFIQKDTQSKEIDKILNALSSILDTLNSLRNMASVAHPNEILLEEAEAMLVINTTRTILHYLNSKLDNNK